ncbi:MAG TPA: hypothetical protein VNW25_01335 [Candidatus Sulfotelmatobacter sp.]|nr:hypothetical protein [Candidatus Sulfotelmatobacter sp.]
MPYPAQKAVDLGFSFRKASPLLDRALRPMLNVMLLAYLMPTFLASL